MARAAIRTDVVKEQLLRRNISQNRLAQKVQISRGYLSQLLRHRRHAGPDVRQKLMKELRIAEFEQLFTLVPDAAEDSA